MPRGRPKGATKEKQTKSTVQARKAKARQQAGKGTGNTATTGQPEEPHSASYSGAPSSRAAKAASGAPMVTRSKVPHGGAQGRPMAARSQATRTAKAVGSRRQADELYNLAYKLGQEPSGRAEAIGLYRRALELQPALWTR